MIFFLQTAPNPFYGCELEACVYYKSLCDYHWTENVTLCDGTLLSHV